MELQKEKPSAFYSGIFRYGVLIIDDAPHPKFPVLHVDDSVSTLLPNPPARQS
jgi:hypothetical protein